MFRFLLSLILLIATANAWSATVEGLRLSQSKDDTRLVVDLDRSVQYKIFTLSNPARLVIDLNKSQKKNKLLIPNLQGSLINDIRYATDKNKLRIVLDLNQTVKFNSQTLNPSKNASHRLVVDLRSTGPSKKQAKKFVAPKQAELVIPKAKPAFTTKKSVRSATKRDIVVAIDAGHGGKDSGAVGYSGSKEKDIVLSIAKRLAKLIDAEPGMRAYLTRDRDTYISLRQRTKRAHQQKADMFISIHADAFKNKRARGASVFVLSQRGASSEAAKFLADKENAADFAGGISLEDKDDLLASVLIDLSQTASLEASTEVANTVLSGLKRVGHVHKKHVESAAFVVLKSTDIPSILVETAFISNPSEERKLKSASHQNKLAHAMLTGIRSYFHRNPLPGTNMAQQHLVSRGATLSLIAQRYQVSLAQLKRNNNLTSSHLKVGDRLMIP